MERTEGSKRKIEDQVKRSNRQISRSNSFSLKNCLLFISIFHIQQFTSFLLSLLHILSCLYFAFPLSLVFIQRNLQLFDFIVFLYIRRRTRVYWYKKCMHILIHSRLLSFALFITTLHRIFCKIMIQSLQSSVDFWWLKILITFVRTLLCRSSSISAHTIVNKFEYNVDDDCATLENLIFLNFDIKINEGEKLNSQLQLI